MSDFGLHDWIVATATFCGVLILTHLVYRSKPIEPEVHEYLEVIRDGGWWEATRIRRALMKRHRGTITITEVQRVLRVMEEDALIRSCSTHRIVAHSITDAGRDLYERSQALKGPEVEINELLSGK